MAASISFVPDHLDFPGVLPGSSGPDITPVGDLPSFAGGIHIKNAPVAAQVKLTLQDATQHFSIRDAFVLEWVEERVEGGGGAEGPPHGHGHGTVKVKVLEVAGEFDGKTPIPVTVGQDLLVRVQYEAGTAEGFFDPNLVIEGDGWETVTVPLSLFPGLVVSNISDTLQIAQGGKATLPVLATLVMGPQVTVVYQMSVTQLHTGLSLEANSLTIAPNQTVREELVFHADQNAPLGPNQVALDQITWRPRGFFINVSIVHAQITVNAAIPNQIRVLRTPAVVDIPLNVHLNGGPAASILFEGVGLPPGVSMDAQGFEIQDDTTVTLHLHIDKPDDNTFPIKVGWTAFNGEQTGTLDFGITVQGETQLWSLGGQTTSTSLGGSAELWLNSDGFFMFKGHVHDSGFVDLFYASLVALDVGPGIDARVFQQNGSVTGTANPFGSRDDDWAINGRDRVIADHWETIKRATAHFRLHAQAEFFDVVESVLFPFMEEIGLVKFFVEQAGDINIGGGSGQNGPVTCETVVTNEGIALHCTNG